MSTILLEESSDLPLVRMQIIFSEGASADSVEEDGISNFSSELMGRGTAKLSRAQLENSFDALGTSLSINADHDGIYFGFSLLRESLDKACALLAQVLFSPTFPEDEAEKLKRELLASLDEIRDDDGSIAQRFFQRQFYGSHPYGRTILGTEQSIPGFSQAAARAWHANKIIRRVPKFAFSGAISTSEAEALIERHFAVWKGPADGVAAGTSPAPQIASEFLIVDKPERTQSQILLGQPAPRWGSPDFYALQVAACAYGGTFTARLMNEIRSKRGLSYGASARLGRGRMARSLVVHVFPALHQTPETLDLILQLHRNWLEEGISEEEMRFAQGYLTSSFGFQTATCDDRLDMRIAIDQAGIEPDYAKTFVERIASVTALDVRRALDQLDPNRFVLCVVSSADKLQPLLAPVERLKTLPTRVVAYDSF